MSERKRIGLREVRSLQPGGIIWDTAVTGFAARRQTGEAVTYLVTKLRARCQCEKKLSRPPVANFGWPRNS